MILGARSDLAAFNEPFVHVTSERVRNFLETILPRGESLVDLALRMEGFLISGIQGMSYYLFIINTLILNHFVGVASTHEERALKLKAELSVLILKKLRELFPACDCCRAHLFYFQRRLASAGLLSNG